MKDPRNCAAKGCTDTIGGFSRFCLRHRWQYYRAGDPNGRILRKHRDLAPYRKMAAEAIKRNREHPGVAGAIRWFEELMQWGMDYPERHGVKGDLAKNLRRLRVDGATGEAMLIRVAAVAFYGEANRRTWADDICHTFNLAHACLYTTPVPGKVSRNGKRNHRVPLKRSTKAELGKMLRETLGLLLVKLWEADEAQRTRDARAAAAIKDAVSERPLE